MCNFEKTITSKNDQSKINKIIANLQQFEESMKTINSLRLDMQKLSKLLKALKGKLDDIMKDKGINNK